MHLQIIESIEYYKNSTPGSDLWTSRTLKQMPYIVISQIFDACKNVYANVRTPHQSLVSLNPVLGKPGGGVRTISMFPMLSSRTINKVSQSVRRRDANTGDKCRYDSAKKGAVH